MNRKWELQSKDYTTERSDDGRATRIGQYTATARSAETATAPSATQPVPAFEPPDHAQ